MYPTNSLALGSAVFGEIVLDRANRHAACFVRRSLLLQPGHRTPDGHPPDTHLDSTPPESDSQFLCLCLSTLYCCCLCSHRLFWGRTDLERAGAQTNRQAELGVLVDVVARAV